MNALTRRFFMLMLCLLLTLNVVYSQEGDGNESDIDLFSSDIDLFSSDIDLFSSDIDLFSRPLEIQAMIYQSAGSGALVDNEDGTHTLLLTELPNQTPVVQVNPPSTRSYETIALATDWRAASGELSAPFNRESLPAVLPFQAQAELSLSDLVIGMTIYSARYDYTSQSLVYLVEIRQVLPRETGTDISQLTPEEVVSLNQDADLKLPGTFVDPQLVIAGSQLFWDTLQRGAVERIRTVRAVDPELCANLNGLLDDAQGAYNRLQLGLNVLLQQEPQDIARIGEYQEAIAELEGDMRFVEGLLDENDCR